MKAGKRTVWRSLALLVAALILLLLLSGCSTSTPAPASKDTAIPEATATVVQATPEVTAEAAVVTDATTFTVWLNRGEDSSSYSDYSENPIYKIYEAQTYKGEGGKEVKVKLEFLVPPTGSEQDVYNTMMGTGEYADVMSMAVSATTPLLDLYNDGIIVDLTPYMDEYMPNYMSFLAANPELALTASNIVNGERKYLQLYRYDYQPYQTLGPLYRRDWVVKYGKNPQTGEAFSGEYTIINADGSVDTDSWVDNVVFPSGGSDPIYISDWEWMFGIFDIAMEDLGITDGYCVSVGYSGYNSMGFLYNTFGGGGPLWYKNRENNISFGATSDEMRTYLQCMNTWYEKGWLDKAFAEHTSDMPFRIDEAKVRMGKVGAWYGFDNMLLGRLDTGGEYNTGIMAFAAPFPMNDVYGGEEQQNKAPYWMYQLKSESIPFTITKKALDKDIIALLSFIDRGYAPENTIMNAWGLSKDQYEATKDPFYTKSGLTEGAYYDSGEMDEDGKEIYYRNPIVANDSGVMYSSSAYLRFASLGGFSDTIVMRDQRTDTYIHMRYLWTNLYTDTAWLQGSFTSQLSAEDSKKVSSTQTKVNEFLAKNLPTFIKGTKDPFDDAQWTAFVNALNKYSPDKATAIYQALIDLLKK